MEAKGSTLLEFFGASPCGVSRRVLVVELLGPKACGPALAGAVLAAWNYAVAKGYVRLCGCCDPGECAFTVWVGARILAAFGGCRQDESWRWN